MTELTLENLFSGVFKGKKILVTGHTGFKGSWLCSWLIYLGAKVYGVSIDIPTKPSIFESANLKNRLIDYRLDVINTDEFIDLFNTIKPDFVFHLAAQPIVSDSYENPTLTWRTNTMGTMSVLEALRFGHRKCTAVFITSDKCYDNVEWVWGYRENDRLGGPDPYSASKAGAEIAIQSYVRSYFSKEDSTRIGIARAGNVIGGGDWASRRVVPDCMRAWSKGNTVELRNPASTRPWQHVLEPLSGYLWLASNLNGDKTFSGEPFNFGPPAEQNHSVGELVDVMSRCWDQANWQDVSEGRNGYYESSLLKLNCDKALHFLKWRPVWDFETTSHNTAMWYHDYYNSKDVIAEHLIRKDIQKYASDAAKKGLAWTM